MSEWIKDNITCNLTLEQWQNSLSKANKVEETICYNMIMDTEEYSPESIKYNESLKKYFDCFADPNYYICIIEKVKRKGAIAFY